MEKLGLTTVAVIELSFDGLKPGGTLTDRLVMPGEAGANCVGAPVVPAGMFTGLRKYRAHA